MTTPADWYQDPEGVPGDLRYWDGTQWTEHRAPAAGRRRVRSAIADDRAGRRRRPRPQLLEEVTAGLGELVLSERCGREHREEGRCRERRCVE